MASPISIRLGPPPRGSSPCLARTPLAEWPDDAVRFRDLNVGPSRHLVRFVEADYVLYALKELPTRIADKEYQVLRDLEIRELRQSGRSAWSSSPTPATRSWSPSTWSTPGSSGGCSAGSR